MEHGNTQRYLKMREIAEAAAVAHSLVRKSARQLRAYAAQPLQRTEVGQSQHSSASNSQHTTAEDGEHPMILSSSAVEVIKQPATGIFFCHVRLACT